VTVIQAQTSVKGRIIITKQAAKQNPGVGLATATSQPIRHGVFPEVMHALAQCIWWLLLKSRVL
jgi:hypothetical protein